MSTRKKSTLIALFAALLLPILFASAFFRPQPASANTPRTVMVHLFEWKWTDIAQECETFLGPKGFAAVQVSPPNEHAIVGNHYWYQRYQPVSYELNSRSGNRAEFIDMVQRCGAVDVDIYVDAVINHMAADATSGQTSGNNSFNPAQFSYPGVAYGYNDFHHCGRNGNDEIQNYGDRYEVQTCSLVGLPDLNTGSSYVQGQIVAYMNDLINIGVAGFRLDASKHMATGDINAIISQLNGNPYIFQEVIDLGGEAIGASEYFQNGDVTEFKYSAEIGRVFKDGQLSWLEQYGEAWGFMSSSDAVVFTDNHDNQRGHGGGGNTVTFQDGTVYDLANVFMLGWPYGYPKVMSSYDFNSDSQGPPSNGSGQTNDIYSNGTPNCFNEWKCEHRWLPIANMVEFRNVTSSNFFTTDWWTNGNDRIAFGRGDLGFVAINREGGSFSRTYQTSMAAGDYCNIIDGEPTSNGCSGSTITVDGNGQATISLGGMSAAAIHVGAMAGGNNGGGGGTSTVTFNVNRSTYFGQNVFVVGNVPELGNWNPSNAVPLGTANYPIWDGSVTFPANTTVEYKYIIIENGTVIWENGGNRTLTTPNSGTISTSDSWQY